MSSKPTPGRLAYNTVCELARRNGYRLVVLNGKTWLIRGLSWRVMRTEDVAAYLSTLEPRKAPSEAENDVEQPNTKMNEPL